MPRVFFFFFFSTAPGPDKEHIKMRQAAPRSCRSEVMSAPPEVRSLTRRDPLLLPVVAVLAVFAPTRGGHPQIKNVKPTETVRGIRPVVDNLVFFETTTQRCTHTDVHTHTHIPETHTHTDIGPHALTHTHTHTETQTIKTLSHHPSWGETTKKTQGKRREYVGSKRAKIKQK